MFEDTTFLEKNLIKQIETFDITNEEPKFQLEKEISSYCGSKYCVTTSNGTTAILLGLIGLGLKEGDEVLIPGYSYPSVLQICKFLKFNYKIIDIKLDTLCMNPDLVKQNISNNTKAVIFINHLGYFGEDVFKIKEMCDKYNCYFIEDSANGIGIINNGIHCGTVGEFGVYSFNWHKLIRTSGGGCLITNNEELYNNVSTDTISMPDLNRHPEMKHTNKLGGLGIGELPPLNCLIGLYNVRKINELISKRHKVQMLYKKYLDIVSFKNQDTCAVAFINEKAQQIRNILYSLKIRQEFKKFKYFSEECNISKYIFNSYIELTQSYDLTEDNIKYITDKIKEVL